MKGETKDYGFARLDGDRIVVECYDGTEKPIQDLRRGTAGPIISLFKRIRWENLVRTMTDARSRWPEYHDGNGDRVKQSKSFWITHPETQESVEVHIECYYKPARAHMQGCIPYKSIVRKVDTRETLAVVGAV